jgi:hypothetical protein
MEEGRELGFIASLCAARTTRSCFQAKRAKLLRALARSAVTTGYKRKDAIRPRNGPRHEKERVRRPQEHKPQFGKQVISVLAAVWEAAGEPWSARLEALLRSWMPWIGKRYRLSAKLEQQLLAMLPVSRRKPVACSIRSAARTSPDALTL